MNKFFELSFDDQRRVLQQASARCGLPPQAIEKDLWVSNILQIVFDLPFADKLIFKGGTSLSKVWHLIERFSEDIDLAVDRSLFGFEGDLTKKQIRNCARLLLYLSKTRFARHCRRLSRNMVCRTFAKSSLSQTVRAIAHIQNRERFS